MGQNKRLELLESNGWRMTENPPTNRRIDGVIGCDPTVALRSQIVT